MEEIKILIELMNKKNKKFNCKFECINDEILRNILAENKTKILHISSHGRYDGKYSIVLENLKRNGGEQIIDINKLKLILDINKINISRMDLVIVSTCFSQDFAEIFLELGAKNIIYIEKKTKVIDRISVLFL